MQTQAEFCFQIYSVLLGSWLTIHSILPDLKPLSPAEWTEVEFPATLHCLKILSDICKMKEKKNLLDVRITKGRESIPPAALAKRELQTALQSMESNWPEKAVRYTDTLLK